MGQHYQTCTLQTYTHARTCIHTNTHAHTQSHLNLQHGNFTTGITDKQPSDKLHELHALTSASHLAQRWSCKGHWAEQVQSLSRVCHWTAHTCDGGTGPQAASDEGGSLFQTGTQTPTTGNDHRIQTRKEQKQMHIQTAYHAIPQGNWPNPLLHGGACTNLQLWSASETTFANPRYTQPVPLVYHSL